MKKEEYITVYDLQIRVRPVPSWEADGSRCHVFLCQPVGGGNGIHLRCARSRSGKAADVAFDLADNWDYYQDIQRTLERSNRPIPQSYLDMCRGQEL